MQQCFFDVSNIFLVCLGLRRACVGESKVEGDPGHGKVHGDRDGDDDENDTDGETGFVLEDDDQDDDDGDDECKDHHPNEHEGESCFGLVIVERQVHGCLLIFFWGVD